ncbi:transposase [Paraburkholderia sp. RL17-381-BIF-C]|uniref:transposase n=1 Tax=Paraburkholderia sp. RL17-381-BIF-C TaxID=3031635 RepID=UPI0038BA8CD9
MTWARQTNDHYNEHHHGESNDEQGASRCVGVKLRHQVTARVDDASHFFFHISCDRNCNVIAPFVSALSNRNVSPLLREALPQLTRIAKAIGLDLHDTIISLDGVYDCRANRKAILNRGMTPNINANPRGRKTPKRGRKPLFDPTIFDERFSTIERVFGWEDKFRRLLLRFERLSHLHYAFKTLAFTMISLRRYCRS